VASSCDECFDSHALLTLFSDELVKHVRACYPSPSVAVAEGNGIGDLIAALSGETARKGIPKERFLAFGLARPIDRGQECRVRDIADQRFGLGHKISLLGVYLTFQNPSKPALV
jgi:hypothetical protein